MIGDLSKLAQRRDTSSGDETRLRYILFRDDQTPMLLGGGDRLIVIRPAANSNRAVWMAARTRSRLSLIEVSSWS